MKSNDAIAILGEIGLYVVTDWPNADSPCSVAAFEEPRPTDETDEVIHRGQPVATAEGLTYEEALTVLLGKVSN